ncbi:MAG: hypothetical protein IIA64_11520, partial [Planctomycetes bacterium]|nr:hypothetical protein [Planctomycetota bacterium]
RTHAGRVTSSVAVRTMLRDDNARVMAEMLAYEIGAALFPFPIDPLLPGLDVPVNSNTPRLSQQRLDLDGDGNLDYFPLRYATDPNFPYNFAPYHVVPFTNWPDTTPGSPPDLFWPDGPGNDGGGTGSPNLSAEGNQVGNPGFGDARWLADIEPLRWDTNGDGILDAFSHWRHMTNIARPNNGWRIVVDISNVENSLVTNLSIPMEQWLVVQPVADNIDGSALFNPSGDTVYKAYFNSRWVAWFQNYGAVYYEPQEVPPNFYNLSDLNANGTPLELGERPQDEFIGPSSAWPIGTPRWNVNRVLVDTDGDGFTDSFWYLAPTMTERGIRQVVAVRIIDNSAMLNANVATRFVRANPAPDQPGFKTRGHTPADLQLVGDITDAQYTGGLQTGFFDNPANHEIVPDPFFYGDTTIGYDVDMWDTTTTPPSGGRALNYLQQIGVINQNFVLNPNFATELNTAVDRLRYWQLAGLRPLEPVGGLTPFGFTEELELRMFHGQNYPWIASRFERAVQANVRSQYIFIPGDSPQLLHANLAREESSEYLDQLSNRELMFDSRRKLTMYNGARNDEMPPWLWWRWEVPADVQALGQVAVDRFFAQARTKLDLREPNNLTFLPGAKSFRDRLAPTLLLALLDGDANSGTSYFGEYSSPTDTKLDNARRAAAGLAANIRERRDDDSKLVLDDAVSLPGISIVDLPENRTRRMLGMERQPFLVEALIAHVHKAKIAMASHPPDIDAFDHVMCRGAAGTTVVVVQIANPFGSALDLSRFQLSVFGRPAPLSGTISPFAARTYYAIGDIDGTDIELDWLSLLNPIDPIEVGLGTWSTDRDDYDTTEEGKRAIKILRMIPPVGSGPDVPVVVDRIDINAPAPQEDYEFGVEVKGMRSALPGDTCEPEPFGGQPWDVIDLDTDTHWIQWVHVTRAWDIDLNANGQFDPDESNPRYVFSIRDVNSTAAGGDGHSGVVPGTIDARFDTTDKVFIANGQLKFSMQMLQKNADFEQVGELLNVWMFGHELEFIETAPEVFAYEETTQTFAEFMIDNDLTNNNDPLVNRLRIEPTSAGATLGQVVGKPLTPVNDPMYLLDFQHAVPTIPAGARVLDAFVCESLGVNVGGSRFGNANGFTGKITPGLINVNTAPPEVMRSAPHMARLVHELNTPSNNPFVRVPDAIVRYRERFGDPMDSTDPLPAYGDRGDTTFIKNLRGERGIASIGEVLLLTEGATFSPPLGPLEPNENWRVDFAGLRPTAVGPAGGIESTRISTDVTDIFIDQNGDGIPQDDEFFPDEVAQDAEEQNLLFAGMSNMLTTRSDVFTVYFRVRSFIQNPTTGVWDATNPEFIVDDSRYVMLVDRSEVNHPNDKPKILYLEKLPK